MNGWVKESLYREHWMDEKNFCKAVQKLAEHYEELPRQLIHRDVHLGNFLFDQGTFSGYIDFDLSQRNIRVFDLCYFLAGLLAAQVGNGMEEIQWYDVISRTTAGGGGKSEIDREKGFTGKCSKYDEKCRSGRSSTLPLSG